jgi:hypothetical protein
VPMMMSSMLVMILYQVLRKISSELSSASHLVMKPRVIFKFLYNFPMTIPILRQVLRQISSK